MRWSYLSRLLARCLEFGLLAGFFHLFVLGEAVGVLRARRVVLLPQDLPAPHEHKARLNDERCRRVLLRAASWCFR